MSGTALEAARAREVEAIIADEEALNAWHEAEAVAKAAYKVSAEAKARATAARRRLHNARCAVREFVLGKGPPPRKGETPGGCRESK